MSLSGIGHRIIKEANNLQSAVYQYLHLDASDTKSLPHIEEVVKGIVKLTRQLKKEDAQ
jgi:hypothetical protein